MAVQQENPGNGTAMSNAFGSATAAAAPAAAPVQGNTQQSSAARGAAAPAPQTQRTGTFSFSNMTSLVGSPMGRTQAAEVLTKLSKALAETYEQSNKAFKITLVPLDSNNNRNLTLSALIVAVEKQEAPGVVAYHTLILEGSVEQILPKFEQINGNNYEILRTAGEAYDAVMMREAAAEVTRQFPNHRLISAMAEVVPRDFNVADSKQVYDLGVNASYAAVTALETSRQDFVDMNLANASRDETLQMRPFFLRGAQPGTVRAAAEASIDAVGQPVRADIILETTASPIGAQQSQQAIERTNVVSRIGAFVDLFYNPVVTPEVNQFQQNQFQPTAFGQQAPKPTQTYTGRLVITSMETTQLLTLPAQIFTLLQVLGLRDNNVWAQALRPTDFSSKKFDQHDFGATNIEANVMREPGALGTPMDLKATDAPPELFGQLFQAVMRPGLVISLDVPECGPTSWINGVFAAAGEGVQRANDEILEATNFLTDGKFANYFPAGGRVCIDESNRIHMGYYIDEDGVKQDIRNLDYLTVLNMLGQKDYTRVRAWSDTFMRVEYDQRIRLAERKKIIQGLVPTAVFTGFGRRVTLLPDYLDAAVKAAAECGLSIKTMNPYADQFAHERATGAYLNSMVINPGQTMLFNRGFAGGTGPASFAGNSAFPGGRW